MRAIHDLNPDWLSFLAAAEARMEKPKPVKNQTNAAARYAGVDWSGPLQTIAERAGVTKAAAYLYGVKHGFLRKGIK